MRWSSSGASVGNLDRFLRELTSADAFTKLPTDVIEDINDELEDKIREDASNARSVTGRAHTPLSDKNVSPRGNKYKPYAKKKAEKGLPPIPDLRYGYTNKGRLKPEGSAMDAMYIDRLGQQNTSAVYFNTEKQGDYMYAHQYGEGNMPQRKWFPDRSSDYENPNYTEFREKVAVIIQNYINDLATRRLG